MVKYLFTSLIFLFVIHAPAFAANEQTEQQTTGLRRLLGETLNNPTGIAIAVLIGFMVLGWLADQLGFLFNKKPLANLINNLILFSAVAMVITAACVLIDKVAGFIFG